MTARTYILAEVALFVVWLASVFLTFSGCGDDQRYTGGDVSNEIADAACQHLSRC